MTLTSIDENHINRVLSFWFEEITPEYWFTKSTDFDKRLETQFEALVLQALNGTARPLGWRQRWMPCPYLIARSDDP
jgi:uncharacterized protein (DUF924 family)